MVEALGLGWCEREKEAERGGERGSPKVGYEGPGLVMGSMSSTEGSVKCSPAIVGCRICATSDSSTLVARFVLTLAEASTSVGGVQNPLVSSISTTAVTRAVPVPELFVEVEPLDRREVQERRRPRCSSPDNSRGWLVELGGGSTSLPWASPSSSSTATPNIDPCFNTGLVKLVPADEDLDMLVARVETDLGEPKTSVTRSSSSSLVTISCEGWAYELTMAPVVDVVDWERRERLRGRVRGGLDGTGVREGGGGKRDQRGTGTSRGEEGGS